MVRWANGLAPRDGARADPALRAIKSDLEEALHFGRDANGRSIRTGDDIVAFLDPMLRNWSLRQRLRLVRGRTLGLGLPVQPWFVHLLSKAFTLSVAPKAEIAHRRDVSVEVMYPLMGMHLAIGRQRSVVIGAGASVGPGVRLHKFLQAAVSVNLAFRQNWAWGDGVVLRFPRRRGREAELHTQFRQMVDDIVTWRTATDQQGRPFHDALECVLARHPDITVASLRTTTNTTGADLGLRTSLQFSLNGGEVLTGPFLSVNGGIERATDRRVEPTGHFRVANELGSSATQRIRGSIGWSEQSGNTSAWAQDTRHHNTLSGGVLPLAPSLTREFYQHADRNAIGAMGVGQKWDSDHDRFAYTPEEMLAEIRTNELEWVGRGMQTVDGVPPELMDTLGRDIARARLLRFSEAITHLGRSTKYANYNINYSMRPEAQAYLDAYQAEATLAARRGDHEQARRWRAARDQLLNAESTWRPLTLIVRERGREIHTQGIALGVKTQTHDQVEVQRTAAQYPAP